MGHTGGVPTAANRKRMYLVRNKHAGILTVKINTTNLHKDHTVSISSIRGGRKLPQAITNVKDISGSQRKSRGSLSLQGHANEYWGGRETTAGLFAMAFCVLCGTSAMTLF